jgi:putative transcriptional regulator
MGGPVQPDTLHFLHRFGSRVGESTEVIGDVFWGGDFEAIQQVIQTEETSSDEIRFYLGYAGWSPGQLDVEIEQDSWILTPSDTSMIFDTDPEILWTTILRKMGGEYALLANFPDDPRLN